MAKLAEALKEAVTLSEEGDKVFGQGLPNLLSKIKKGVSEVRKDLTLFSEVPEEGNGATVWFFIARICSDKPTFIKQAWELAALLLENDAWLKAFGSYPDKERLGIGKATGRDGAPASKLFVNIVRLLPGKIDNVVEQLMPVEVAESADPGLCASICEALEASDVPGTVRLAVLKCEAGRAIEAQAQKAGDKKAADGKRTVVGGSPTKAT